MNYEELDYAFDDSVSGDNYNSDVSDSDISFEEVEGEEAETSAIAEVGASSVVLADDDLLFRIDTTNNYLFCITVLFVVFITMYCFNGLRHFFERIGG